MRIALITGGIRGIGAAIAVQLKNDGYTVLANYVSNTGLAEKFSAKHDIPVVQFDVSDATACQKSIEKLQEKLVEMENKLLSMNEKLTQMQSK